jgi:hypothetical protein
MHQFHLVIGQEGKRTWRVNQPDYSGAFDPGYGFARDTIERSGPHDRNGLDVALRTCLHAQLLVTGRPGLPWSTSPTHHDEPGLLPVKPGLQCPQLAQLSVAQLEHVLVSQYYGDRFGAVVTQPPACVLGCKAGGNRNRRGQCQKQSIRAHWNLHISECRTPDLNQTVPCKLEGIVNFVRTHS